MTTEVSIADRAAIRDLGERQTRRMRAEMLVEDAVFERISPRGEEPQVWRIHTPKGTVYDMEVDRQTCQCEDFARHSHLEGFRCKHLIALGIKRAWFKGMARDLAGYFGGEAA